VRSDRCAINDRSGVHIEANTGNIGLTTLTCADQTIVEWGECLAVSVRMYTFLAVQNDLTVSHR